MDGVSQVYWFSTGAVGRNQGHPVGRTVLNSDREVWGVSVSLRGNGP